jgi:hypothetical protein
MRQASQQLRMNLLVQTETNSPNTNNENMFFEYPIISGTIMNCVCVCVRVHVCVCVYWGLNLGICAC